MQLGVTVWPGTLSFSSPMWHKDNYYSTQDDIKIGDTFIKYQWQDNSNLNNLIMSHVTEITFSIWSLRIATAYHGVNTTPIISYRVQASLPNQEDVSSESPTYPPSHLPSLCSDYSRMEFQKDKAPQLRIYDISSQVTQEKLRDTQTQPYQPGLLRVKATVTPISVSKQEEC